VASRAESQAELAALAELAEDLTRRIRASAKYRSLDESLVRRVSAEAAQRFSDRKAAVKYARRKLHQG
jgi:hypothetical protein